MASEKPLTEYTEQEVLNMSLPSRPYGKVAVLVADADNAVVFPVATHMISIYSANPIWIAFAAGVSNLAVGVDNENRIYFEGGGRFSFTVGTRLSRIWVSNFTASQAVTLYITVGD